MSRKTVPPGTPYTELPEKEFWGFDRRQHPNAQRVHWFPVAARSMIFYSLCKRAVLNRSRVEPVAVLEGGAHEVCKECSKRHSRILARLMGM